MKKTERVEQVTVKFKKDIYDDLKLLSSKNNVSMSELIRGYVDKGMNVDKSKNDIDFIRLQIREELQIIMKKEMNRVNALYYKIGMYVIPQALFSSEIICRSIRINEQERITFKELWEKAKHETPKILNSRNPIDIAEVYADYEKAFSKP